MTRVRKRRAVAEILAPAVLTAIMLTLAWLTFRVQEPDVPATPIPAPSAATARDERSAAQPATKTTSEQQPSSGTDAGAATTVADADVVELRRRRLLIPVPGVDAANLVQTFHESRDGREHEALDILAPRGTPAVAVDDGRIEKLFTSQRGGLTAYLFDDSGTYCYYYAHLDRYADDLKDGDRIRRGHVVGYVGTTGNAPPDSPHLHFAVFKLGPEKRWWEGTPVDPYAIWR
jgi:murein DD-endopeptidase MepM/ murein hydrolase activator NlpD